MEEKFLKKFEKRLINLRNEIIKVMTGEDDSTGSRDSMDEIDHAQEMIEHEMGSLMSSNHRANLVKVEDALKRIKENRFGQCEECGREIPLKRLEALPFATYCITCQQQMEDDF